MKRMVAFASRNLKELIRDPLSYIFCLGFPLVMLGLMTLINDTIPPEANMTIFQIQQLTPGVAVFGLSFVMLFATLLVSKDRCGSFLIRLFSSPMTAFDFVAGYVLPLLLVALIQVVVCFTCGGIIGWIAGTALPLVGVLLACLALIPGILFFVSMGLLFGTLLNDKAAPPCSSIIISLCGLVGGIWFSLDVLPKGHFLAVLCDILPFSHFVDAARQALSGDFHEFGIRMAVGLAWAVGSCILSVLVFHLRMKREP